MTQEEKAKAYDEVREKIALRFGSNVADEIFSQFEMSEDERIRKWIRKELESRYVVDNIVSNVMADKALAWLEKQGDKDSFIEKELGCIKGYRENAIKRSEELEKKGEQKPVIIPKFRIGDTIRNIKYPSQVYKITKIERWCYISGETECTSIRILIADQDKWELVEQKLVEWGEEDEEVWKTIISDYIAASKSFCGHQGKLDWLKSLKDRVQIQPEQDKERYTIYNPEDLVLVKAKDYKPTDKIWSDEDEKMRKSLIASLSRISANTRTDSTSVNYSFIQEINWLKSLHPQKQWKPSDKQMKAIEHICDGNYNVDLDILDSIYRDFKKLREE